MVIQTAPTREGNLKRALDIVRIGHDTLPDEHEHLKNACIEIIKFQSIVSATEGIDPKKRKVYQYQIENQSQIEPYIMTLNSATATFEAVINHNKERMFKLELLANGRIPEVSMSREEYKDSNVDAKDVKKPSFKEKIFGSSNKRIVGKDEPYQHSVDFYTTNMKKLDRLERFGEYQAYGVDLAEYSSYTGMMQYLRFHRTRFKFDMVPSILRNHKAYIELVKAQEREGAVAIATSTQKEIYSSRNDMPMFQNPQVN